jgi:hypothetical protein
VSSSEPLPRDRANRALALLLRIVIVAYAGAIFFVIWMGREFTFARLTSDPAFAVYSLAVLCYVLGRFVVCALYRAVPDRGHRPMISVIVPAFNEGSGIEGHHRIDRRVRLPGRPDRDHRRQRRLHRRHLGAHGAGSRAVAADPCHRSGRQLRQAGRHGGGHPTFDR